MSTKVNGETRARLGLIAKQSAAVRGQVGRAATVAGRCLLGAIEQKFGIFYLPGFTEDRRQICFLCSNHPHFFLMCATHMPHLGLTSFALPTNHHIS